MTPSHLGPCRKEVLEVSPPKGDIPGVTKHHYCYYCLCFVDKQKIILENLTRT